ncbi:MAG: DUF4214 domain-containing protein [Acidimicrobiales bacterium]
MSLLDSPPRQLSSDPHRTPRSVRHRHRRRLSRLAAFVVLVLAASSMVAPPITPSEAAGQVRGITLPIHPDYVDKVNWRDTYGAPRSGGRSHIGVDMMGPKMVPLLAVRSGTITWGRFDNRGGSIVRFRDEDGWEYQYIHLNNDSPGTDDGAATCTEVFSARLCDAIDGGKLRKGTPVTEGEVIGYLGDSGNAESTRPHLHFEIYRPSGSSTVAVNPTASVDAARERVGTRPVPSGPPAEAAPGADGFVDHLWYRLNGRRPSASERAAFEAAVAADGQWSALGDVVTADNAAAAVDRLYLAFFQRYPDAAGIRYWAEKGGDGHDLEDIAEWFAESDEFKARYANVGFRTFLDRLYADVLDRPADDKGKQYWLDELSAGRVDRGTIVVQFTQSPEMRELSIYRNEIVAISLVGDGSVPSTAEIDAWAALRATTNLDRAIESWFQS